MKRSRSSQKANSLADHAQDALKELQDTFVQAVHSYRDRIAAEISELQRRIETHESPQGDLRDLLTLLRNLQVKPDRGRRKDLKKIDALVGDLTLITDNWVAKESSKADGSQKADPTQGTARKRTRRSKQTAP